MAGLALSRSAQAVLTAAIGVTESPDAEAIAAAVLRAAAEQVAPPVGHGVTLWDKGFNEGEWAAYTRLNVIANELESLRCNS